MSAATQAIAALAQSFDRVTARMVEAQAHSERLQARRVEQLEKGADQDTTTILRLEKRIRELEAENAELRQALEVPDELARQALEKASERAREAARIEAQSETPGPAMVKQEWPGRTPRPGGVE